MKNILRSVGDPALFSGCLFGRSSRRIRCPMGKGKERQTRSFAIAFYDADAPRTTANFKKLVQDGFYKKTTISPRVSELPGPGRRSAQQKEGSNRHRDRRSRLHVAARKFGENIFAVPWRWAACRTTSIRLVNRMEASSMSASSPSPPRTARTRSSAR